VGIFATAVLAASTALAAPPAVPVPGHPAFPAPPRGAIVFSRQLRSDGLALGVVPQPGRVLLQASVRNGAGTGVRGLGVTFTIGGRSTQSAPCGSGCYRATVETSARPAAVTVAVRQGRTTTRWRVTIPRAHSAHDAAVMLERAGHVWRSLRSVSFTEALASDARPPLQSTWQLQAPDRVAYQVHGGWSAVIIGGRRWDRSPGAAKWVESQQTRLTQPVPSWGAVTDAYLLGRTTARRRPAWKLSFFDPRTPAWFTVTLDAKTLHTLDVWMIATAHFMHDRYSGFDSTAPIVAPT
jgi:hypothetical protein